MKNAQDMYLNRQGGGKMMIMRVPLWGSYCNTDPFIQFFCFWGAVKLRPSPVTRVL